MTQKKTFLFYMGHPAHYHNIKHVADGLTDLGHKIVMVARKKDVLFDLLKDCPYPIEYLGARKSKSKVGLVLSVLSREFKMLRFCRKYKPDVLVGTDLVIAHVAKLLGKHSVVINEDDAKEVPLFANYGIKYSTCSLAPTSCDISPYEHKKVAYKGYHELAYLHPDLFTPSKEKIAELNPDEPYSILRFAELTAHHDDGKNGIDDELAMQLIQKMEQIGRVFITSERKLEPQFESYRISIEPKRIHHALYYAQLYVGDSQTMAAEAAVLGTPSIRYNDFVGKLGYLEELEHEFELTFGIPTSEPQKLMAKLEEVIELENRNEIWEQRRKTMLETCINVHEFWLEFLNNFPDSWNKIKN